MVCINLLRKRSIPNVPIIIIKIKGFHFFIIFKKMFVKHLSGKSINVQKLHSQSKCNKNNNNKSKKEKKYLCSWNYTRIVIQEDEKQKKIKILQRDLLPVYFLFLCVKKSSYCCRLCCCCIKVHCIYMRNVTLSHFFFFFKTSVCAHICIYKNRKLLLCCNRYYWIAVAALVIPIARYFFVYVLFCWWFLLKKKRNKISISISVKARERL